MLDGRLCRAVDGTVWGCLPVAWSRWSQCLGAAAVIAVTLSAPGSARAANECDEPISTDSQLEAPFETTLVVVDGRTLLKHVGVFCGEGNLGEYRVPYEILVDPDVDGRPRHCVVEPPHQSQRAGVLDNYLGQEFFFGGGLRDGAMCHAMVGWSTRGHSLLAPGPGFQGGRLKIGGTDVVANQGTRVIDHGIVGDFAGALVEDADAIALVGEIERLDSMGFSASTRPLHELLHAKEPLFDLTLIVTFPMDDIATMPSHKPPKKMGRVVVFNSESDVLQFSGSLMRHPKAPSYHLYEVAGGPHVAHTPSREAAFESRDLEWQDMPPLDWTAGVRAIAVAAVRADTEGTPMPASLVLADDPDGDDDLYDHPRVTGAVARDGDMNAIGGLRFPDLAIGRGQFKAILDPSDGSFGRFFGEFSALDCEPGPNGEERFANHHDYVQAHAAHLGQLVSDGYVLEEDAIAMAMAAMTSGAGNCPR